MKEKLKLLKETFGSYYKSHDEYLFSCPFCDHHKRKLSINLDLNVFKCWKCNSRGKDVSYLIKRFANSQIKNKWFELIGQVDMSNIEDIFTEKKEVQEEQILSLPKEYIFLGNKTLPFEARKALKYLGSRGIFHKEICLYKLGFCHEGKYKNRIIIPS